MIGIGGISIDPAGLNAMGVATIVFPNDTVAAQVDGTSRGKGAFYDLYGAEPPPARRSYLFFDSTNFPVALPRSVATGGTCANTVGR